MDFEFERNGSLDVAVEPHQVEWLEESLADATARGDDSLRWLDEARCRPGGLPHLPRRASGRSTRAACLHPAKLASELARVAEELGVEIFERSPVPRLETPGSTGAVGVVTDAGRIDAARVVLATNVFPSLLKRNRLMTVPVYDYVLMTEPLTAEQLAGDRVEATAGHRRHGEPVPLLPDDARQPHPLRRLRRRCTTTVAGCDRYEERPAAFECSPTTSSRRSRSSRACASPTSGRRHRHEHAVHRVLRHRPRRRVAYAAGFTGLGVASTRFAAEVMLDLLERRDTERTSLEMVRKRPLPFPPEPAARSASTRRGGRSTAPITTRASATCC